MESRKVIVYEIKGLKFIGAVTNGYVGHIAWIIDFNFMLEIGRI